MKRNLLIFCAAYVLVPALCGAVWALRVGHTTMFEDLSNGNWNNPDPAKMPAGKIIAWGDCDPKYGECNVPEGNDFVSVAGGKEVSMALKSNGSIVVWGSNRFGNVDHYKKLGTDNKDFVRIAMGMDQWVAMKKDGTLVAGGGIESQGGGSKKFYADLPKGPRWVDLNCGGYNCCAIRADGAKPGQGSLACWGDRSQGSADSPIPKGNDFVSVSGGNKHLCARRADGQIHCWAGDTSNQSSRTPKGPGHLDVCAAGYKSLGIAPDGTALLWGNWEADHEKPPKSDPNNPFILASGGKTVIAFMRKDGTLYTMHHGRVGGPGSKSLGSGRPTSEKDEPINRKDILAVAFGWYHGLVIVGERNKTEVKPAKPATKEPASQAPPMTPEATPVASHPEPEATPTASTPIVEKAEKSPVAEKPVEPVVRDSSRSNYLVFILAGVGATALFVLGWFLRGFRARV